MERQRKSIGKAKLRVFYGVSKINKILKKRAIAVMFENDEGPDDKNLRAVSRWMHIVHVRFQTSDEKEGAIGRIRMFHTYYMFIDEKPYKGDWNAALHNNFLADENHVSEKERQLIKEKLKTALREHYDLNIPFQSTLQF